MNLSLMKFSLMKNYILLLFCVLFLSPTFAQDRTKLEAERKKVNNQLQETSKKLTTVQKSKQKTAAELKNLQQKVKVREQSAAAIAQTVEGINQTILEKDNVAKALAADVDSIQQAYALTATLLYRYQRTMPQTLSVFSPDYWDEYWRAQQYLLFLENLRRQQLQLIVETQASLQARLVLLKSSKSEKNQILQKELSEKAVLSQKANQQNQAIAQLSKQEKQLRAQLAQAQRNKNQLNSKIESVIRGEIASAKTQSRQYSPTTPANPTTNAKTSSAPMTAAAAQVHKNFAAAKGKLSPPVRGTVVSDYGRRPHPDLPLVIVENNGIDIKTAANASVSAIYEGTVVSIFAIPSMGNAVMVKHGDFFTTYSGLTNIKVRNGERVSTNQSIGSVSKDPATGTYLLHFEVWRNKQKENPRAWVKI